MKDTSGTGERGPEGGSGDGSGAHDPDAHGPRDGEPAAPGTSLREVAQSVAAAFLGVQSSRNRERDFTRGRPIQFVIGGVIGTLLFLLSIYLFVRVLIGTA